MKKIVNSIVAGERTNVDFNVGLISGAKSESILHRFSEWEDLDEDTLDSLSLNIDFEDYKLKGRTRGISFSERKLTPIQEFRGVERKEDPRDLGEETKRKKFKVGGKTIYEIIGAKDELFEERGNIFNVMDDGSFRLDTPRFYYDQVREIYREIAKDYNDCLNVSNPKDKKLLESTVDKVLSKVSTYLVKSPPYSGIALYNSAYNHVLLDYTYSEAFERASKISKNLRNGLTTLRALFQKCDLYLAMLLRTESGYWTNVKLTAMDIPYSGDTLFKFADLFAGIGSFRKALERAGGKCVFTNEILEQSMYAYSENFNIERGELNLDYIESFVHQKSDDLKEIPDIDCVVAGFPCKPFSKAGKQQRIGSGKVAVALDDPAFGFLIFDTLKIIKKKQPAFFILENVPDFVIDKEIWDQTVLAAMTDPNFTPESLKDEKGDPLPEIGKYIDIEKKVIEKGKAKTIIIQQYRVGLNDIKPRFVNLDGQYEVHVRVLNSSGYSCQSRTRCFIIGIRKDLNINFDYGLLPYIRTTTDDNPSVMSQAMQKFDKDERYTQTSYTNKSVEYLEPFQLSAMHDYEEKAEIPYTLPFGKDDEYSIVSPRYNLAFKQEVHNRYKMLIAQKPKKIKKTFYKGKDNEPIKKEMSSWLAISEVNASPELQSNILKASEGMYGNGIQMVQVLDEYGYAQFNTLLGKCSESKNVYYESIFTKDKFGYRSITPREAVRIMTFDREPSARMYLPIADTNAYTLAGYSIVTKLLEEITLYVVANLLYNENSK
mgnify:CR=1 FL=1